MRDIDWWHSHENQLRGDSPVRFDLYVRTLGVTSGPHSRQASVLDRIDRLDRQDDIDTARTTVWGDSVCVSDCCSDHGVVRSIRDRIEQFREWGDDHQDVTLGFERREIHSTVTGERFDVVDLPTACLAVYVDAELDCLFPATIGGQEWTIQGYLDWFEEPSERADTAPLADA